MSYSKEIINSKGKVFIMKVTTVGGDLAGQEFFEKETGLEADYDEMMS